MKLFRSALLIFSLLALSTSCVSRYQQVSNVVSLQEVDMSKVEKMKKGEACANNILFIIHWGDTLITRAAKQGNIQKVHFVENEFRSYLVFNQFCTLVWGESNGSGGEMRSKKKAS